MIDSHDDRTILLHRFRGNGGEWLGNFTKFIGKGNVYLVELGRVFEGLKFVRRLNISYVEFPVYSIIIIKSITSNGCGSIRDRSLIENIR
jgi:hypothetical protein